MIPAAEREKEDPFSKSDYQRVKSYLESAIEKYDYGLDAYVLLSNHSHLLIEMPKANPHKLMHCMDGSWGNYINKRKGRSEHVF